MIFTYTSVIMKHIILYTDLKITLKEELKWVNSMGERQDKKGKRNLSSEDGQDLDRKQMKASTTLNPLPIATFNSKATVNTTQPNTRHKIQKHAPLALLRSPSVSMEEPRVVFSLLLSAAVVFSFDQLLNRFVLKECLVSLSPLGQNPEVREMQYSSYFGPPLRKLQGLLLSTSM